MRSVLVITTIAFAASIVTTSWAAQSTKSKKTYVDSRTAPKPQIKSPPAGSVGTMQPMIIKSDLQVGVIKVTPQNPREGQQVTFEGNVMNYGAGAAQQPEVRLTVSGPAGVSFPIFNKKFNVTLTKNQGITFVQKFVVPKHGNYSCTFKLDPANKIAETNNNNNQKIMTFHVNAAPDLIVCISNGKRPPVGGSREIKAVVKNIGSSASNHAANLRLRFYVEGKGVKFYDIPSVSPGHSHTITRNHSWSTSGTKTITARVLYPFYDEVMTQNNEVSGSYFVRLPHHDKYSAAPKVKCSTNVNFNSWQQCNSQYP